MEENATVTNGARRFRTRRRRFLLVATAALAAVGAAMGISFTADTGTSTVTASAGSTSPLVYKVTTGPTGTLPPTVGSDTVNWGASTTTDTSALRFGTKAHQSVFSSTGSDIISPSWSPVAGTAGSVTTAGDVFVVDGRTASAGGANHITVTVYVTNLANLQAAYSSFAWPIDLYTQWIPAGSTGGTVIKGGSGDGTNNTSGGGWAVVDNTHPASTITAGNNVASFTASSFFLTNTGGYISYYLPTGTDLFYEIALDSGGSYYTVNTGTAANLNPTFFVTAQAT